MPCVQDVDLQLNINFFGTFLSTPRKNRFTVNTFNKKQTLTLKEMKRSYETVYNICR